MFFVPVIIITAKKYIEVIIYENRIAFLLIDEIPCGVQISGWCV